MPADDDIHAPVRIQNGGELFVLLKANVREQHGKVNVNGVVGIADIPDLAGCFADVYKGADQFFRFCGGQHLFRNDTDKKNLHAVNARNPVRLEHSFPVGFDMKIGIDDRKIRAFFQKQQMGQAVINLVVADGGNIRANQIHDADGGGAFVFRVDDTSPEHISRDGIDDIFLLMPNLIHVAGKQRHAAHQLFIDLLRKKIAVHIVGVEDCQFFDIFLSSHAITSLLSLYLALGGSSSCAWMLLSSCIKKVINCGNCWIISVTF